MTWQKTTLLTRVGPHRTKNLKVESMPVFTCTLFTMYSLCYHIGFFGSCSYIKHLVKSILYSYRHSIYIRIVSFLLNRVTDNLGKVTQYLPSPDRTAIRKTNVLKVVYFIVFVLNIFPNSRLIQKCTYTYLVAVLKEKKWSQNKGKFQGIFKKNL